MEAFKKETTVEQLIEAKGLRTIKIDPPPGFFKATFSMTKEYLKYSLQEIDELRRSTAKAFSLPDFIICLVGLYKGSLCIVWHIPLSEMDSFRSASPEFLLQISTELVYIQVDKFPKQYCSK